MARRKFLKISGQQSTYNNEGSQIKYGHAIPNRKPRTFLRGMVKTIDGREGLKKYEKGRVK